MKSITLTLEPERDYSEKELNARLAAWADQVGQAIWTDHITLRRFLVDAGYLTRDTAGHRYRVAAERAAERFEADVAAINPTAVVEEARRRAEERKRAYMNKRKDA